MTDTTCEMHDQTLQFDTQEQLVLHLKTDLNRIAAGEALVNGKFKRMVM